MKCPACPLVGREIACWSEQTRTPAVCDMIAAGTPGASDVVLREAGLLPPLPTPVIIAGEARFDRVPPTITFAVARCQHRTQQPNCGCAGKWRCERDGQDVTWPQCIACKTAEAVPTP